MAKGRTPPLGLVAGTISCRKICAEDLCWDVCGGESPKGFPHAVTWVSVKFGHPSPMLVPSATISRGSVGGRDFDGEQELSEEALLIFFSEGEGLGVAGLRFGLRIELGPISLDVSSWGHSADALDQLACSPTVTVFHIRLDKLDSPLVVFVRGSRGVGFWFRGPLDNVGLLGLSQGFECAQYGS